MRCIVKYYAIIYAKQFCLCWNYVHCTVTVLPRTVAGLKEDADYIWKITSSQQPSWKKGLEYNKIL